MQVDGLYNLQVRMHNYTNPTGKCPSCVEVLSPEPGCCDRHGQLGSCDSYRCDTYFTYILRALGSSKTGENCTTADPDNTSLHWRQTSLPNINDGRINFSDSTVLGLDNPLTLGGWDNSWNVRNLCTHCFKLFQD